MKSDRDFGEPYPSIDVNKNPESLVKEWSNIVNPGEWADLKYSQLKKEQGSLAEFFHKTALSGAILVGQNVGDWLQTKQIYLQSGLFTYDQLKRVSVYQGLEISPAKIDYYLSFIYSEYGSDIHKCVIERSGALSPNLSKGIREIAMTQREKLRDPFLNGYADVWMIMFISRYNINLGFIN